MFLLQRDSFSGASDVSGGTMVGGGMDVGRRGVARLRLGMDAQVLFGSGRFMEVLRGTVGVAF